MIEDLQGQRIVITGGTGGIGRATAKRLLKDEAQVIVSSRTQDKLDAALSELSGDVSGHVLNLEDNNSVEAFFDHVGAFDHLVTPAATAMFAPILEMDFGAARGILESKQWGQMLSVHYAAKTIAATGSITLFSGTVTQKPLPGATMFAAVGAATEASARIWGMELAPIRVNTVVPGIIATPVWGSLMGDDGAAQAQAGFAEALPVGRVGTPEDVAHAVEFLISNGFVSGISLVVDGGHRLI